MSRLVAVRLDNIGDVIMLGPALESLKRMLPGVSITLLTSPVGTRVAPLLPSVDDAMAHRASWQSIRGTREDADPDERLLSALRKAHFDAAVIFTSFSQSPHPAACACRDAGIPLRLGQSKEFGGSILTHWVTPLPDETHQVDRNLHLLETAGIPAATRRLNIEVPRAEEDSIRRLLAAPGTTEKSPLAVLFPGASCSARRYPEERFSQVARLLSTSGLAVVVVGSERESALCSSVASSAGGRSMAGISVPEIAALVEMADLVVTNNSAGVHIADALDTPVVVLYSGAEHRGQWRPRSAPSVVLGARPNCSPCHLFECDRGLECLDISPRIVVEHGLYMLKKSGKPLARELRKPCRSASPESPQRESDAALEVSGP